MILKRKQMSEEPFSFKSQYKQGAKSVKCIPGGAGCRGLIGYNLITPEDRLIAAPPLEKKEMTKEKMTKEKMPRMTKEMPKMTKEKNTL